MTPDLKTEEGRKQTFESLNLCCLFDLKDAGFNASDTIVVEVSRDYVRIGIKPYSPKRMDWAMEFGCEVKINCSRTGWAATYEPNEIHFGCSGSFSPDEKSSYWCTLHAASALQLWDKICPIVDNYCNKYRLLEEMIREANQEAEAAD